MCAIYVIYRTNSTSLLHQLHEVGEVVCQTNQLLEWVPIKYVCKSGT